MFGYLRRSKEKAMERQAGEIYDALAESLQYMKDNGIDRIPLFVDNPIPEEMEAIGQVFGKFTQAESDRYYPDEVLHWPERELIGEGTDGKSYTAYSLVRENVGGLVEYGEPGIEIATRSHFCPMLPRMKDSRWYYKSRTGALTGEDAMRDFAKVAAESGWTSEMLKDHVTKMAEEYRDITLKLSEDAGVFDSLLKMEERGMSDEEHIFSEMRAQIDSSGQTSD